PGQRSFASSTPSPSESRKRWHPTSSTSAPGGVLGHLSSPSGTPSLSESSGQPAGSTTAPAGVPGHWSRPSSTPSPSASAGQPLRSEEHTSELQSRGHIVCRLLLEKKIYEA